MFLCVEASGLANGGPLEAEVAELRDSRQRLVLKVASREKVRRNGAGTTRGLASWSACEST